MAKWLVATGLLYCNPLLARGGSHTGSIIEDLIMLAFFWLVFVPLYRTLCGLYHQTSQKLWKLRHPALCRIMVSVGEANRSRRTVGYAGRRADNRAIRNKRIETYKHKRFVMGINQRQLWQTFHYINGGLYWRGGQRKGKRFGTVTGEGYRQGKLNRKQFKEHRLIFLFHKGYLPREVDHKDKVKDNNAIANLRDASRSQNACNYDASNKHGYRGVVKMRNGYGAFIRVKGEKMYLGYRACVIEAAKLYDEAAVNYHGEFATLNFGD